MTDKKESPQEIDLIELFTNIGNWIGAQIKWLFNIGERVFYFFLRNAFWFALFVILGGTVGYFSHKIAKLYFHSELIGFSHTISNIEVIQSLNNWNYSSEFSEQEMKKIKAIGATYVLDINDDGNWDMVENLETLNSLDTNIMKQRLYGNFCIQIEVFDTAMITMIKNKVLDYLSNNQRVISRNAIRLKQQEDMIPKLRKEIAELDSLKKLEYFENNKPTTARLGEMLLIGEKETKLYHTDVLDLYKQLQKLEKDLYLNKEPFEIILDFSVPAQEENNMIILIIRFIKVSLVMGFFIILFFDQRKYIFSQIKKAREI